MKHRGSFRSAASALGVLLYVLSLSPAASAEVLTIGSDSEMTYAEDTVFENASSESTLSMGSGNTWDNDSSEQVTITNADGSFAVKGPRAGIYVPSGKTLTMKAQELTLSSTTNTQLIDDSNWFFTPLQAAGLYAEGGNVTLEGEKGITLQGFNHGLYASGPSDNNDTGFFPDASDDSDGFWESELPYDPTNPDMPPSGINTDERTQITLTTNGSNTITATAGNALQNQNPYGISGIQTLLGADVTLSAGKDNLISVNSNDAYSSGISVGTIASGGEAGPAFGTVTLTAGGNNQVTGATYGIRGSGYSSIDVTAEGSPITSYLAGKVILKAEGDNIIDAKQTAVNLWNGMEASLSAKGTNVISAENSTGAQLSTDAKLTLTGSTKITAPLYGIMTRNASQTSVDAQGGTLTIATGTEPIMAKMTDDATGEEFEAVVARPIAAASLTGSQTEIKNASLSVKSSIAFLAAHAVDTSNVDPGVPDPFQEGDASGSGQSVPGWDGTGDDSTGGFPSSSENLFVAENETASESAKSSDGSTLSVTYGKGSSVEGHLLAYDKGTITMAPTDGATLTLTGNLYAYGEDASVGSDFGNITRIFPTDPEAALPGGTISLTLSDGSLFTGQADTGLLNERIMAASMSEESLLSGEDIIHPPLPGIGAIDLTLDAGSTWNMTEASAVTTLSGDGGVVQYQSGGDSLEIGTLSGSHTFAMDLDADDGSQSDMLYVENGTSDKQTLAIKNISTLDKEMEPGDAVRFATVKNPGFGFGSGTLVAALSSGIYNNLYKTEYRSLSFDALNTAAYNNDRNGGSTYSVSQEVGPLNFAKPGTENVEALYNGDSAVNIYVVKSREHNEGAKTPSRLADLSWRYLTDLDTFTNRSGHTQYFTPDAHEGAWIRFRYRNLGIDGTGELDGNTYELGYTTVLRNQEPHKHRLSTSVAYTKNEGHFEGTSGNLGLRDTAISVYDTHVYTPTELTRKADWKKGTYSYWDSYLKYHYGKEDYSVTDAITGTGYAADYTRHSVNLSTEYGRVNKLSKDWSVVPQAQVQVSYLGGVDTVDSQGISLSADHSWSLVGRLGFDLVKHLDPKLDSKCYFKASLLHEFLDGDDVTAAYGTDRYITTNDQKGTWGVIGLGYSVKTGDKQSMYFDMERYVGHDFHRTYSLRAGFNWKF